MPGHYQKVLFTVLFVVFMSTKLAAQFTPVKTRINTPYGPTTIKTYQYMPYMHGNYGTNNRTSYFTYMFDFNVTLTNDSTFQVRSRIHVDSIYYISVKHKRVETKICPSDTKLISVLTNRNPLAGIPNDSTWTFRVETGAINLFSDIPVSGYESAILMQTDSGPITPITAKRVQKAIPSDAPKRILKLIDSGQLALAVHKYNAYAKKAE
ncbi:MAG: hypothetical protein ABJG41_13095 [Cyclobacteriaceae bacterium]